MKNHEKFRETFSALHASGECMTEVLKMTTQKDTIPRRWGLRTVLAAAMAVCLMATMTVAMAGMNGPEDPAVTYEPFQPGVFESEEEFLNAIFGLTGYDHVEESLVCDCPDPNNHREMHKYEYTPATDRVALDQEVAEELKDYITHVGQSMSWNGYTLTIDSMFYDKLSGWGCVAYTFEGPQGAMDFDITPDGRYPNYYVKPGGGGLYVAKKSNDTKVTTINTFCMDEGEMLEFQFSFNVEAGMTYDEYAEKILGMSILADSQDGTSELGRWHDSFEDCPYSIEVRVGSPAALEVLAIDAGDVKIEMTSVSMRYTGVDSYDAEGDRDHSVVIRFADGTEYIVHNNPAWEAKTLYGEIRNCVDRRVNMHSEDTRYLFNRLIDLDDVVCVILDGTEYYVN